jgi:hypothetical protein
MSLSSRDEHCTSDVGIRGEVVARIDHLTRPGGQPDDGPLGRWRRRLARLRGTAQDRLWREDEKWAADRGHRTWRSSSGWAVHVHDQRFDRRHVCDSCGGSGCAYCVDGVVTDPDRDETE